MTPTLTNGQLIEILKQLPADSEATFLCPDGYEDGVSGVLRNGTMIGYGRPGDLRPTCDGVSDGG
jgi:hypothetical protein